MILDVNSPRGQQTLADERDAIAIFESHHPQCRYCHTPKRDASDIDGVVVNLDDYSIRCVAETKCRYDVTLDQFRTVYADEWLVTFDKIIKGMKIAEAMRVPLYGFLYIVSDKVLLMKRLWSPLKGLEFDRRVVRKTRTQATCNGSQALRDNAFLDMTGIAALYKV
jgi:hypothetical protein